MPLIEVALPVTPRGILVSRLRTGGGELRIPAGAQCSLYVGLAGSVTLSQGDVRIALRDGELAVLSDSGEDPSAPGASSSGAEVLRVTFPGKGALFETRALHLAADALGREPCLRRLLELVRAELADDSVFGSCILQSVLEALVMAVRRTCSTPDAGGSRCARGVRDARVASALKLMLARPGTRWSVATLAKAVGLSRASFARRFLQAVGVPPLRYLAERRFELAAELLTATDASLAEIASQAGYGSEFAFSRAFKRRAGEAPAFYRKRARAIVRGLPTPTRPLALAA